MLDSSDLARFIQRNQILAEVVSLPVETPTVEAAARAVGARPGQIVKSLLFLIQKEPVVAIACGPDPVDRRPLAVHFNVGRKRVKLADAEAVLKITGYPVGAVPPFGHLGSLPTIVDRRVLAWDEVFAGGGAIDALLRLAPSEILRVTQAIQLDLRAPGGEARE